MGTIAIVDGGALPGRGVLSRIAVGWLRARYSTPRSCGRDCRMGMGNSRVAKDGEVFLFGFIYAPLVRGAVRRGTEAPSYEEKMHLAWCCCSLSSDNCCFWRRGGLKDSAVSSYY